MRVSAEAGPTAVSVARTMDAATIEARRARRVMWVGLLDDENCQHAYNDGDAYDIEFDQKVGVTHVATLTADFVEALVSEPTLVSGTAPRH